MGSLEPCSPLHERAKIVAAVAAFAVRSGQQVATLRRFAVEPVGGLDNHNGLAWVVAATFSR